jgi:hypothetical protein
MRSDTREDWEQSLDIARERLAGELAAGWPARRYGRLAGFLIAAGALASVPSYFFAEQRAGGDFWILMAIAAAAAAICFRAPWERLPAFAFHVAPAAGTALVIASTRVVGFHVEIFYSFVIIFASFVFVDRRAVAVWVGICGLALLAPLVWEVGVFDGVDRTLMVAAVNFPVFIVMAIAIVYLREHFDAEHRRLFFFAREVVGVTERLEGGHREPRARY